MHREQRISGQRRTLEIRHHRRSSHARALGIASMSEDANEGAPASVAGERGAASVQGGRSLQSRVSNVLAMGLMGTLGLGFLGWYYAHTFSHQGEVKKAAQSASRASAAGEMALPSLGKIEPPAAPMAAKVLGPAPEAPPLPDPASMAAAGTPPPAGQPAPKPAWMQA